MRSVKGLVAALSLAAVAGLGRAADTASGGSAGAAQSPTVEKLIARLSSADYALREAATTGLMVRDDLDDSMLRAAFATAGSPERTHRLIRIALHRFYKRHNSRPMSPGVIASSDRAAVGVAIAGGAGRLGQTVRRHQHPPLPNPAFLVTETLPGFPAYAYLRAGDLIVEIDGKPLNEEVNFSDLLKSYQAGQLLTVKLLRDGKSLELTIPTDSYDRLASVYPIDGPRHDEAWAMSRPDFQRYLSGLKGQAPVASVVQIHLPSPPRAASTPRPNTLF